MGLAEIRAEAKMTRERLADASTSIDAKVELAENIIPLFEMLLDEFAEQQEDVDDLGEAVDTLIDNSEDVLHPETAAKFIGVLEIAKLITKELETALPKLDELARKRCKQMIKAFRQGDEVLRAIVAEITVVDEDEEPPVAGEPTGNDNEPGPGDDAKEQG